MNVFFHIPLTNQELPSLACSFSHFSHVWLCVTPWTIACQPPLVHGILQARILEWVAMPSSRGSSWPRDETHVSLCLLHWQVGLCFFCFLFFFVNLFILIFNWRLITLQYCSGFCHTFTWISQGSTCVLILNPPPASLPIPSLRVIPVHRPWALLSHALNLDWRSVSHMVIYMFQCYSLKSSHPHLLPQSPKVCSLHLCLFCCLTYRVIITIFLNSIYMC